MEYKNEFDNINGGKLDPKWSCRKFWPEKQLYDKKPTNKQTKKTRSRRKKIGEERNNKREKNVVVVVFFLRRKHGAVTASQMAIMVQLIEIVLFFFPIGRI